MPAQGPLTSSVVLLLLLGTAGAGPFSPRSNVTLPAPRPPPKPGGRAVGAGGGNPASQLYEHTVEGGEKQVVFTHRINLPPSAGCGCAPGTEPPVPASEVQALRVRLEILEELVKGLKEHCTGGCCPAAAQAGTGQTDVRSLCSLRGVFDLSRCACSCEPGWGGPTCSEPTETGVPTASPPAASASCPDDCNDQGRCVRGRCVCFPGYAGPSCGWPSCPGDCQGRGRCVQGVCVCRAGFTGPDCSQRSCPGDCHQRGRCEAGRCVCDPGYAGEDCGARSCPRDCSQRGRCEAGRCVCDPGYAGEDCGARSCPRDCGEGGRCVDGRCVCWPGYAGEDCGTRTCPRDCRGRGRCEDGECICDAGYAGEDCGVRACPGDCHQRGRCEDGRCVCWPGYAGPDCGTRACPRDCRGRGRCEDGVCACHAGYSGEDCGVRACPGDCRGRGRCEAGRCVCWPGYTGRDCGARACPGDCRGRGRCVDGRCVCNPGFAGEDCGSRRCPGDCRGRGRCEDGVCVCQAGYGGEDCGARTCPGACRGRGQCLDGRCVCDDGYAGEDCGVRRCPRDCSQRGVCQDGVCSCWEGYAGEDCGVRACPAHCHGRGRCEDGRCLCHPGYTGPACATRTCPADCRGRGRCVQGVCVCHAGYGGEDCGREEPPASACPGGCGPRELCRAGQCVCVEGFRGPDCAIQTCPGDCRGRGECRQGSCVCQEGYAGEDCGEEIPAIEGMRMHLLEETTVRTEWTPASGPVDAYEIQFIPTTEGASPPFTARVPSSASAYDQRGLAPGQDYQVTVRALRGTSWGPPTSKTITTMIDGPQDLRVVAVTPTTLELSWLRPQAEVDRFVVSYVSAGNQRVRLEVPPEADGTLLTDLMPGVEYVVTVTAERGRAVSYPASVRANTAPGHYNYPEVRPPALSPQPRPRPARPPRPVGNAEEGEEAEPRPGWSPPPSPRRPWGNLTAELGRFRGSVQDLERHLRARGYPLRANQTYAAVARHLHDFLQRRRAAGPNGAPAPAPRPGPDPGPAAGTQKRDSPGALPRHPKPEVLGSSADGALLLSLDGLRGHFERVVLRWRPQPPAEGPAGELAVPGTARTVRLPDLSPGTTYHVEVHGVRAGQASKSYAFITTTGSLPSLVGPTTDEPPPAGPSTTQGAEAPILLQNLQELGELRVLGKDETGQLRVAWTAQPDVFAHFQLNLQVPEGPGAHEELLPGDARQALVPPPPPGAPYTLLLHGILPGGKPSVPITYQGIMDRAEEEPRKSRGPPRLGELTVSDLTSDALRLHWTVPEGEFDSFLIQYKDKRGLQVIPVEGPQRSAPITSLEPGRKYKFVLYGLVDKKRHGPLETEAKILPQSEPGPGTPPRLGQLWVTDPTPDSLRLSWTVPEGQFDSFMVQYRDKDGRPQVIPVEGPERSVVVSPLDPDHKYRFTLFGMANKKRYGPLTAEGTTAPEKIEEPPRSNAPEQPLLGELTVTGVTPDSLRLSWTVAQGPFDSFTVQYKDAQGQPQAVPVRGDENEVTVPGLEPNRKYKMNLYGLRGRRRVGPVSVVAKTATEEEPPSPTEASTEAPEPPMEPLLGELTVTGSSPNSLGLSWTVPQGHFDSFAVQYKDSDGRPQVLRVGGQEREATVENLEPGHRYKMHLYGIHQGRRVGPVSAIGVTDQAVTTQAVPPTTTEPAPKPRLGELAVTDATPDSLSLSWTVPEGQFDHFLVQYRNGDGQPQVVRVLGHEDQVTISGLEPDHKYKMNLYGFYSGQRVGPVSAIGVTATEEEPPSPTEASTEAPEPPMEPLLGELTVTGSSPDSLGLSWTVPQGHFDSFAVQYKDSDGRPQVLRVGGQEREATVENLEPGRRYKMHLYGIHQGRRVGPVSTVGTTDQQPEVTLPATEPPLEPRLGELTVTDVTPNSVSLSWTVPEGQFDSFMVQYKDRGGQPQEVPVAADQLEVTVPNLEPARKYKMNVYGLHGRQRVGPLSVVAVTDPLPPVPTSKALLEPRLGELTVTDVATDAVGLSWTVPEGEFDSFLVQYKDRDGQPQVVPVAADQRAVTVSNLEPNRKYKFLLFGMWDGRRRGPVSVETRTAAQDDASPPRLGDLWVTDTTTDSLRLSWTVPEGQFDSFVVQFKGKDGPQVVPVEGHERSATIAPLDSGRKYKFLLYGLLGKKRVGPLTVDGTTDTPDAWDHTKTKHLPKPRLGEELQVTRVTQDSVGLSWTVPEGQFDSFVVQYKDSNGQPQVVPVEGSLREVSVSGLDPAHRYKLLLYGLYNNKRVGPLSAIATTDSRDNKEAETKVPMPPVAMPQLSELTVEEATPHSLHLSWMVTEGQFDSFEVQYTDRDGQLQVVRTEGDQTDITLTGLESEHRYLVTLYGFHDGQRAGPVQIEGVTESQEEEEEEPTEAPTTTVQPPTKPRLGELAVTDAAPDSLSLSWTVPEGQFDHFLVQYRNGDGQPQVVRVPGHEDQVTISGLEPDHKYKMNLYGFHSGQRVGPVSAIGVTATEEEPPSPTEASTEAPEPPMEPLLGELTVTGSSPDSLGLSWTVPQGHFDSFAVQYKDSDGRPQVLRVGGQEREATVENLEPGRRYKMHLYGIHQGRRVGPVSAIGVTAVPPTTTEPAPKPRLGELAVTDATPDSLSLSWTVPEGQFDHFLVQYRNGDGQPQVVRVLGHEDQVTISGLEPDHKYKMNLYGFHSGQRVGPVSAIGLTAYAEQPLSPPPSKPRLGELAVTDATPDSLSLSWTVPEGQFDHFLVQYRNGDGQPKVVRVPGHEDQVTISGLEPDHKYKMNLYGFHSGQRVGPVSAIGVTATEEEPPSPTEASTEAPEPPMEPLLGELTVTGSSPDSLGLSWTVPQGHFDSFAVQYKDSDGRPQVLRVGGQEREATVENLEPGRRYKMHLYGIHQGRRMGPVSTVGTTEDQAVTTQAVPPTTTEPAPKPRLGELAVTDATPDSLSLSWTVPEGQFDHFLVQYRNGDGQPKVVRVPGHEDQVTISGLEPDHKYKMNLYGFHSGQRVGPVSAIGVTATEEEPPSPTEASTEAPEPPMEPLLGELTVTGSSPDSLGLSWTVPQGHFDSFAVQYKDSDGRPQVLRVGGQEREATVENLEPGRRYKMHLYGIHQGRRVGPVSTIGVTEDQAVTTQAVPTTTPEPPPKPRLGELAVTDATPDSLSLSWTVPEGQFDHFLVQYRNGDGQPKVVRVPGHEDQVTISGLEPDHKYKMNLYGFHSGQRVGPVSAIGVTEEEPPGPTEPSTEAPEPPTEPRLGELTVTDATPDSLSLSWTVPEGQFDHFLVQYTNGDGQPKVERVPGHEDQVTISGLEPDHKYKMNLYGVHRGQRVGPVSATGVTATEEEPPSPTEASTEAPEPPMEPLLGELTVTGSSPDSLGLSWTVPQGHFDSFAVQYKDSDGRPQVLRVGGQEREATVENLEPGRRYKMHLYGIHQGRRVGPVSAIGVTDQAVTTQAVPPTTSEPAPKPRLGELAVTDATPDSLSLSWTVPEGQFDHFLVQYTNGDGQPKVERVPGHEDQVTISGLEPDHKYKMNLYGVHRGQRVGPVSAIGVTATEEEPPSPTEASTEAPEPPTEPLLGELTVTGSSPDSLGLSWTVPQGHFDSFAVQYKDSDGRPQVLRVGGQEREATVENLEPGRRYKMHLYGIHQGRRVGPVSAIGVTDQAVTTQAVPPTTTEPAPKPRLGELAVTDATPDSLSLSWTVPEGQFDHFLVQYRNGDGQPKMLRVPGYEDQVTISGLEPDHKYKMNLYGFHSGQRVGPVSAIGVTATEEEPPSPTEASTEAPEPPTEPLLGELTVTGSSPDSLGLSWTVPQGHFDSFTVQYKDSDGRPQVLRVGGQEREATVENLEPGRRYKMHLYGIHQGRRVGPVSTVGTTDSLPTQPPVEPRLGELAVEEVTSDTARLSWTVAQGLFDSFLVQYKDAQGQPQAVPVSGDLHEATIPGLDPARKYKFLLFGLRDGKRRGPVSVEAKTLPDTKPSPRLGELAVTDVTTDAVGLSWTVPEGEFDSFLVQYKDRDGQPQVVPVAADQREVTVPSLEPNRKYKFLLYGLAGRKRLGPVSAEGTTAPLEKAPQLPHLGELAVTEKTSDSLRLSWTVAQGLFDSFLIQYRDKDGQPQAVPVTADQREVTVEGLEPGRKYKFLLYGLSGGKRLGPISALGVTASSTFPEEATPTPTASEPPEAPRLGLLTVTETTPDSLSLEWSVTQGPFESFVVQYQDSDRQTQALLVDGDQNKVLISGLEPSTSYKFSLYGLHEGKRQGPISAEGTTGSAPAGQTLGDPGPRLSQLSVTDVTTISLRLNWEAPLGAFDSFLLRFGVPSPSTLEPRPRPLLQRELMVPGTRRTAILRDLRPGTLYSLTLYGLRGPHKADSIQGTARTLSPVLESPRDLQFSEIGETSAKVTWVPPLSRVDSFKVSYQLADGGEPQSVQVDGRAQSQNLQGLIPGARYEVTVVSVRGFEESEPLTGFLTTVPDGPTQLRALNLTEGSALLHWTAPQNPVDTYNVHVSAPGAPSLQASAPGSAVDYPLRDLVTHINYTATVRGLRGPNLTSPASITFTTGLKAPQDLEAKDVTPRTALLTWTEPQVPPTGYLLSFDTPGGQTQEVLLPAGVTSHRLVRLYPSTLYNARLQAMWGQSLTPPVATSFTTGGLRIPFPRDCGEEMQNGAGISRTTTIFLNGNRERPLDVFCDMETDGGGWLVFQRRMNGKTDFWRDWEEYAHGFGNISGEFWLGNEALHSLTQSGDYSMRVDLRAGHEAVFAQYDSFQVDSAAEYYRLHLEGYHGTAGDSMSYHSGSVFSARDRDPNNLLISCAVSYRGAWWYRNCHYANLNGLYGSVVDHQGVSWYHWKGFDFSVPFTEMKLRPRSYQPPARGG
ncbi:tenascin-X [Perognathus longimembris pacificus]|uniref:tenascin-X n=1 Tax=Perognathus longimembris pacificus TaxID=214514 RepID=UPI002018C084|nr:tenascin-X [Perognathus longimembris pacificus]